MSVGGWSVSFWHKVGDNYYTSKLIIHGLDIDQALLFKKVMEADQEAFGTVEVANDDGIPYQSCKRVSATAWIEPHTRIYAGYEYPSFVRHIKPVLD